MAKKETAAEYIRSASEYRFGGKKPTVSTQGIWEVRGADPNCDLSGSHYTPLIGYFDGSFQDVYDLACTKPSAYGWGGLEATITLLNVVKVDDKTVERQKELAAEKVHLEARLKELKSLLP
jgi:hypothetical protein